MKLLEPVRFNRKKKELQKIRAMQKEKTHNLPSNLYYIQSSAPLKISNETLIDQNIQKHKENLGSKLTNHKMTKFPERSEVCSLYSKLNFFNSILLVRLYKKKKVLTSFVLNKHLHWFNFLSFRSGSSKVAALSASLS